MAAFRFETCVQAILRKPDGVRRTVSASIATLPRRKRSIIQHADGSSDKKSAATS